MRVLPCVLPFLAACSQAARYVEEAGDTAPVGDGGDSGGQVDGGTPEAGVEVNEILASNDAAVTDEAGDPEDFLELYNGGDERIDLSGWGIADDPASEAWRFPEGAALEPGAFLVLWCDQEPEEGALHADFKLSGDGETVVLWDAQDNELWRLDYGPQETDVSIGRIPDGSEVWQPLAAPSPGASNQ